MRENNKSRQQPQNASQETSEKPEDKPDPNVRPPQYHRVTEGYDPSAGHRQKGNTDNKTKEE